MSFFSNLFSKTSNENVPHDNADLVLYAPVSGTILPLKQVPDVVISERIVGDGIAIVPESSDILAPCDGMISSLIATNNAFALRAANGLELYISFGIGLDRYSAKGCYSLVKTGDMVKKGQTVLHVDMPTVSETIESTITSLIVIRSSGDIARVVSATQSKAMANETPVLWVELNKAKDQA